MATRKKKTPAERWAALVLKVSTSRPVDVTETEANKQARITRLLADYDAFVLYYFPHYTQNKLGAVTHCAPFHIAGVNALLANPYYKGFWKIFRGGAKSSHADIFAPLYLKQQRPVRQLNVMMLIGKNAATAQRLLQDIQAELQHNPRFIHDFGPQIKDGSWEQGEFQTMDGCGFVALGMGQPPRGTRFGANRPDYIVADDLDDDKLKKNPKRIREAVDWLYRAVIPTMDIGLARFVLVNNLICKKGIMGTMMAERPDWHRLEVNALDANGNPNWARYTKEFYAQLRKDIGTKAFLTEYQNDPQEDGGVFTHEQISWQQLGDPTTWLRFDAIVAYADFSYSTSLSSDYTAITFWAKQGTKLYKLRAYLRQTETPAKAVKWWFDLHFSLPDAVRLKIRSYAEANATQKTILKPLFEKEARKRGVTNFVKFDTQKKGDKNDRIGSMTTQYENGDVVYCLSQHDDPDMQASVEQLTSWAEGAPHDDGPDADQSAWAKLETLGRLSGRSGAYSGGFTKNAARGF
jgi:predicted phage terminase large subunit-like protein